MKFTILGYSTSCEVYAKSVEVLMRTGNEGNSVASQYLTASNNWQRRKKQIHEVYGSGTAGQEEKDKEKDPFDLNLTNQCCDINDVCTHVILFECIEERTKKKITTLERENVYAPFLSCMLERLVATLPSLAIQAQGYEDLDTLADLVNRKIPLLLLDSRERWPLVDLDSGANAKTDLADGNDHFDPMEPPDWAKNKFGEMAMGTSASAAAWADWTEKRLRQHYKLLHDNGHREWWTSSTLSFLRGVRDFQESRSKRNIKAIQKTQTLHAAIEYGVSGGWSNSFSSGMVLDDELETKLVEMYFDIEKDFLPLVKKKKLKEFRQRIKEKKDKIKKENEKLNEGEKQNKLTTKEKMEKKFAKQLLKDPKAMNAKEMTTEQWLATYDILTSKTCYAESIFDLDGIALIMSGV